MTEKRTHDTTNYKPDELILKKTSEKKEIFKRNLNKSIKFIFAGMAIGAIAPSSPELAEMVIDVYDALISGQNILSISTQIESVKDLFSLDSAMIGTIVGAIFTLMSHEKTPMVAVVNEPVQAAKMRAHLKAVEENSAIYGGHLPDSPATAEKMAEVTNLQKKYIDRDSPAARLAELQARLEAGEDLTDEELSVIDVLLADEAEELKKKKLEERKLGTLATNAKIDDFRKVFNENTDKDGQKKKTLLVRLKNLFGGKK